MLDASPFADLDETQIKDVQLLVPVTMKMLLNLGMRQRQTDSMLLTTVLTPVAFPPPRRRIGCARG
eukprot:8308721-Pyramimonas_sp.AAC.1